MGRRAVPHGALFAALKKRARGLGFDGKPGAITFVQRFSSALLLNPHLHVLVPEGLFALAQPDGRMELLPLPPPDDEEVEALLRTVVNLKVDTGRIADHAGRSAQIQARAEGLVEADPLA